MSNPLFTNPQSAVLSVAVLTAAGFVIMPLAGSDHGDGTAALAGLGGDYNVVLLTTAAATPCYNAAGGRALYLVGVINNSLLAQGATVAVYDNATAASGLVIASIGALGISQVLSFPAPGLKLANGATAQASAVPATPGIQILVR